MTTPQEFEHMEWVEITLDGWKLKDDAPQEVVIAFNMWIDGLKPDAMSDK